MVILEAIQMLQCTSGRFPLSIAIAHDSVLVMMVMDFESFHSLVVSFAEF